VELYVQFDPAVLQVVDTAGDPATTIAADLTTLNIELANEANNTTGNIRYDAGKLTGAPSTGTFQVATVYFKVIGSAPTSQIRYVAPSDVFLGGASVVGTLGSATVLRATPTPTLTPTNTPTLTITPTPTSMPGPPQLLAPANGAILPQPIAPNEWYFEWQARTGPCYCEIHISGPGGRSILGRADYLPNGYNYRYVIDEPLPDDALTPWHWGVSVLCSLGSNTSETRTFSVQRASTATPTVTITVTSTSTPTPTPTATPTNTPLPTATRTPTVTPTETPTATATTSGSGPSSLPLPNAPAPNDRKASRQPTTITPVVVINEGAYVYWTCKGQPGGPARSGQVINGPHIFMPLLLKQ
jgi:hypothetical protein